MTGRGGLGGDDANAPLAAGGQRGVHCRGDHLEDGQVREGCADVVVGGGAGSITGNDYGLDALLVKELHDAPTVGPDCLHTFVAIGQMSRIAEEDETLGGQATAQGHQIGQPAHAGVKDADGPFVRPDHGCKASTASTIRWSLSGLATVLHCSTWKCGLAKR